MCCKSVCTCVRVGRVCMCVTPFWGYPSLDLGFECVCVCVCVHVRRDAVLPCDVEITWRIFTETHFSACIVILVSGRGCFESHLTTLANRGILI